MEHKMSTADVKIDEKVKVNLEPPKMWKVVLLNDDQTPMEFVIELLTAVFRHEEKAARDITLEIHETGSAIAGIYSFEIAEQKGVESTTLAREHGFPLQIQVEEE
jgi:ATP-dependent Clp protease adaptor protein ClpS